MSRIAINAMMGLFVAVVFGMTGCGGSSPSSSSPPAVTAKVAISGAVSFPALNSIAGKRVAATFLAAGTPTVTIRDLNGTVVATATVTGSGTTADPYRYSVADLDIGVDYVIKVVSDAQVMKALVSKSSLLTTTTRDIDIIATAAVFLAEKKLSVTPGTIGETKSVAVTSSALATLQPVVLENNIKTAVNTVLYTPASATQANVDLVNLVNVVTATVNTGVNTAQFLSGAVTTPVSTTQYTLVSGAALANSSASVTNSTALSSLISSAIGYTPPTANSVSYTSKAYDYNTIPTGVPLNGVSVTTVGLLPELVTTTDAGGVFTLAGIPLNASFYIKLSKATYSDAYSNTFSLAANQDNSERPYALYLPEKLASIGNTPGSGVIRSRVLINTNLVNGYIGSAVVTATDKVDGTAYPVKYIDGTTGLISSTLTGTDPANGQYVIVNVPSGHSVDVTAARTGYTFNSRTFTVHSDAVSEARITGTAVDFTIQSSGTFAAANDVVQLTAVYQNSGGTQSIIPNANLTWSSSNSSVIKVNSLGVATVIGGGTATITATETLSGKNAATTITLNIAALQAAVCGPGPFITFYAPGQSCPSYWRPDGSGMPASLSFQVSSPFIVTVSGTPDTLPPDWDYSGTLQPPPKYVGTFTALDMPGTAQVMVLATHPDGTSQYYSTWTVTNSF